MENMLPIAALVVSIISLLISGWIAWNNHFKPANMVGGFSRVTIWSFSSYKGKSPTGEVVSRLMTPYFWISNLGAKAALIEDIRIEFTPESGTRLLSFATSKVPTVAIESPGLFKEKGSIDHGGPFGGFCLNAKEVWQNSFAFSMSLESFENLKGVIKAKIQIRLGGKDEWQDIVEEKLDFGTQPIHLQSLKFGDSAAGSSMNSVYSQAWMERKDQ